MAKCIPQEKRICLQRNNAQDAELGCLNYCVAGIMSRCSAGTVWDDHKKCKYAEKSTISNRCMHFIEAIEGHCDCVEAQKALRDLGKIKDDRS